MTCDILCLGEPLYELNEQPDGCFLPGFGGDTSNVAIAAARLDARTAYVTLVGADMFGDALLALWRREGVDATHVRRLDMASTGVYFVTHGPCGHAFTYLRAGSAASRMSARDVPTNAVSEARYLHVSAISQAISASASDAVSHAIALARAAGKTLSYDANLRLRLWSLERARSIIKTSAALVDIFKTSSDDAKTLVGLIEPDAIADYFLDLGAGAVIVTSGEAGSLVATHNSREAIPAFQVDTVDATGAGDAFTGALLSELCRGSDLFAAARFASAASALSTCGYGAVGPLPRRAAVEDLLRQFA